VIPNENQREHAGAPATEHPSGPSGIDLSIVFPAYNEAATIAEVVEEADTSLRHSGYRYELLVLDDGSSDTTWARLTSLAEHFAQLRLLRHRQNQGITASLNDLFQAARGTWVFPNGSDGQWRTAEVLRMLPLIGQYDVIVGQRQQKHYSLSRATVSWLFNLLPLLLFGVRTYDAGSIKLMPRKLLEECSLISEGPFREAERLIRAAYRGYRIGVISVACYPRRVGWGSGARWRLVLLSARDLLRCWWDIVVRRRS
jgi:glycosyltransferase involved in cell wall biosynthesis